MGVGRRRSGFTLIELVVAVVIGSIVIYGLAQTIRLVFRQNTVTRANTESSRAGLEIDRALSNDLKQAGLGLIAAPNIGGLNVLQGSSNDTLIILSAGDDIGKPHGTPQLKVSSHPCPSTAPAPCILVEGNAASLGHFGVDSLLLVGAPGTGARLLQITSPLVTVTRPCGLDCGRSMQQAVGNSDAGETTGGGSYDDLWQHVITSPTGVVGTPAAGSCASAGYDPPVHADGSRCDETLASDAGVSLAGATISGSGIAVTVANCRDGNPATVCFNTDASVANSTVTLDLGGAVALTTLGMYVNVTAGAAAYPGLYRIDYADAPAGPWSTVVNEFRPRVGQNQAEWPNMGAHRYWRFVLLNTPGGSGTWTIGELYAGSGGSTAVSESALPIDASATYTAVSYVDRTNLLGFPQIPSVTLHSGVRGYPLVTATRIQAVKYYLDSSFVRPSIVRVEGLQATGAWKIKAPVVPDVSAFTIDVRHGGTDDSDANYAHGIGVTAAMLAQGGGNPNYVRTDVPPNVAGATVWTPGFSYVKSYSTVTAVRVHYTASIPKRDINTNALVMKSTNFVTTIATENITGGGTIVP